MRQLFTIDLRDYKATDRHFRRPSARGVIVMADKRLAMVYSAREKYFKFPGGGIREGEDGRAALIREVQEEVGLAVIPESVREYGSVLRLQKSDMEPDTVFEQENLYYFCSVEAEAGEQNLDAYEAEAGFELRIVPIDEAIAVNKAFCEAHRSEDKDQARSYSFAMTMIERECRVLEMLREEV